MRLLTFSHQKEQRLGSPLGSEFVIDLREAAVRYLVEIEKNALGRKLASLRIPNDMVRFLEGGDRSLDLARRAVEFIENAMAKGRDAPELMAEGLLVKIGDIRVEAPVPRPGALISAGKNFADHVGEMSNRGAPRYPVAFLKMPHTIAGPWDDIPYPRETEKLDYEVELAIVIGRPCKNVSKEEVFDYIAGYMAFNDISARDVVRGENGVGIFLMGKNFPGFSPMGPFLVLKDEVVDAQNLKLESRVNGETRQCSDLSHMIFKIADMVSYWSRMGLRPGDILTSGTPRGVAAGRKEGQVPWWLRPGDLVEAEVEKVGCLRNRVVQE